MRTGFVKIKRIVLGAVYMYYIPLLKSVYCGSLLFKNCDCFSSPKSNTNISWLIWVMSSLFSDVSLLGALDTDLLRRPQDSIESLPHSQTAYDETIISHVIKNDFVQVWKNNGNIGIKLYYRFTGTQTVFYVTLEYHTIRLGEPESFVDGLKCIAFGWEPGKYGWIHGTPFVIDDLERALRVLGHGHATSREYAVRCYTKRHITNL